MPYAHHTKIEAARRLRRPLTPAEQALWRELRGKRLGMRARVQHVIRGWIVDFYLPAARLVIEVDGDVHDQQVEQDERRTATLGEEGLVVIRVRNDEVLADVATVLDRIEREIAAASTG
ncbi:MAG: hypothetical protein JWM10_5488 [Myxococcaceae bacterium]|nr:hypothetical protein [Myxococcaceae bacterium]